MKRILIVAHPDDEILFFSSILENIEKVIVCFSGSKSKVITDGREALKSQYPLSNIEWLNLDESDVYGASDWKKPVIADRGIRVSRDEVSYRETFDNLIEIFKIKLISYDVVYTHNPWGEYGHEEHVSVFNAVLNSVRGYDKKVFVSCYLSDRSQKLFLMQSHLLLGEIQSGIIPKELCARLKRLYIDCNCWTWDDDYEWPNWEIFAEIMTDSPTRVDTNHTLTAYPPVMLFSRSFRQTLAKKLASKVLSKSLKNIIKRKLYSRH